MATTPNYDVNYDDERFTQVEADKQQALTDVNNTYNNMIAESDQYFNEQIQASKDWADKQSQIQQENTDFAIEQIEQQKEQANKDYQKEQSAAYVDWQKQSNKFGANAEQMAASGLQGTGYSESSQVGMYNNYQNRVATAKEGINEAYRDFDNQMTQARLANSSALAEIALTSLQQQIDYRMQGFQYKNSLLTELLAQQQNTEDRYYSRYQDVLSQINQENALAEQMRQYNETMAEEKRQYDQNYQFQMQQYQESIRQFEVEMARLREQDAKDNDYRLQQLELQKQELEMAKQELEQAKQQYDAQPMVTAEQPTTERGYNPDVFGLSAKNNVSKVDNIYKAAFAKGTSDDAADYLADMVNAGQMTNLQAQTMYAQLVTQKGVKW